MTREEKAVQYKHSGYNCCQAVVLAMADLTEVDEETLCKMSSGFAAGMGCMEATCGSLIGATMIAGLMKNGTGTVSTASKIHKQFKECSGATICKDIKGRDTGEILCECDDCVRNAVRALESLV